MNDAERAQLDMMRAVVNQAREKNEATAKWVARLVTVRVHRMRMVISALLMILLLMMAIDTPSRFARLLDVIGFVFNIYAMIIMERGLEARLNLERHVETLRAEQEQMERAFRDLREMFERGA